MAPFLLLLLLALPAPLLLDAGPGAAADVARWVVPLERIHHLGPLLQGFHFHDGAWKEQSKVRAVCCGTMSIDPGSTRNVFEVSNPWSDNS